MTEDTSLREKDRIQGMVRSINQYRNGDPKAICAGSDAQILYAMTDARHDVLVLWDFAVAAGFASEAKDRRIEALKAENEHLRTALGFYRDGFQFHPKRSPTGINLSEWKAKQELLDDCGNVAIAALSGKEGQS